MFAHYPHFSGLGPHILLWLLVALYFFTLFWLLPGYLVPCLPWPWITVSWNVFCFPGSWHHLGTLLSSCHSLPQHYLFLSWDLRRGFIEAEWGSGRHWDWKMETRIQMWRSSGWRERIIHIHGEMIVCIMRSHTGLMSFSLQPGETRIFLCLCYLTQGNWGSELCDLLKVVELEIELGSFDSKSWTWI